MKLKKLVTLTLLVTTISTSIMTTVVSASPNVELLEAEKLKGIELNKPRKVEVLSEEQLEADRKEAEDLKIKGDKIIKESLTNGVETIKDLADILANNELATKAGPVTEIPIEDIKYIMDVMVDTLKNDNIELSEEMISRLDHYILSHGPYVGSDKVLEYIESYNQDNKISARISYNRTNAVNYAYKWVHAYNYDYYPNLDKLGGDCTNYVSQALAAGGHIQYGTWWIDKLNSLYLIPTTTNQYRTSWSSSWPDASAWTFAPAFKTYWESRVLSGEYNATFVRDNPEVPYKAPYLLGDAVQIMKILTNNGVVVGYEPEHTVIITKYSPENQDYRVSYHSDNVKDRLLSDMARVYCNKGNYRIKFYRMADSK